MVNFFCVFKPKIYYLRQLFVSCLIRRKTCYKMLVMNNIFIILNMIHIDRDGKFLAKP